MGIISTPENQYIALCGIAAFGLLQLFGVLLFWFAHLRHHRNHPVYRIRHPSFWIFCMGLSSFQITWKATITFLRLRYHLSANYYMVLNQIGVLLIGYGCVFTRGFVLWYTVKFQQHQENQLFERILVSETYESCYALQDKLNKVTSKSNPFLHQYEQYLSNPYRVFVGLQSLYAFLVFIGALCNFFVSPQVSKLFIIAVVMLFWAILASLVFAIWRSEYRIKYKIDNKDIEMSNRFTDHFNFRWEITIIWLDVLLFVPLRSWISIKFQIDTNSSYANTGLVLLAFLTLLSQLFPVLTQIFVPFWTYTNRKSSVAKKHFDSVNDVTVFDVLSDKHGFFLFVNHAVQELNLENISCLIAIYQFKYLKTPKAQQLSNSSTTTTKDSDIVIVMDEKPHFECVLTTSTKSANAKDIAANANDIQVLLGKLLRLQWDDMPLTESMSNLVDTKYVQAWNVYRKFFDIGSIYTVNVSGAVRDYLSDVIWKLQQMHEKDASIERCEAFQEDILKIFDSALPDLCSNLMDMMDRFRATKEFQSLSIA